MTPPFEDEAMIWGKPAEEPWMNLSVDGPHLCAVACPDGFRGFVETDYFAGACCLSTFDIGTSFASDTEGATSSPAYAEGLP